jgi:hypothetical protein
LSQGELKERALLNLQMLQSVIQQGILYYDFTYNKLEIRTDLNICVLSDGKSIFKHGIDCIIPMVKDTTTQNVLLSKEQLNEIRLYLSLLNSISAGIVTVDEESYSIHPDAQKLAETDFIEARNNPDTTTAADKVTTDTLHLWLSIGRLLSLSNGQMQLTTDVWNRMKDLERQRNQRIHKYHAQSTK